MITSFRPTGHFRNQNLQSKFGNLQSILKCFLIIFHHNAHFIHKQIEAQSDLFPGKQTPLQ